MLACCILEKQRLLFNGRRLSSQSFKLKARGPFTAHRLHRSFTAGSELTHIYCTVRTRKNHPNQPLVLESGKSSLRLKTLVFFAEWSSLTYKQRNRNWPHVNELNMEWSSSTDAWDRTLPWMSCAGSRMSWKTTKKFALKKWFIYRKKRNNIYLYFLLFLVSMIVYLSCGWQLSSRTKVVSAYTTGQESHRSWNCRYTRNKKAIILNTVLHL